MKVYARGRRGAAAWGVVGAIAAMLAGEATATITVSRPDSGSLSYADGEQITGVSGRVSGADDVRVNAKDYEFTGAAGLVGLEWGEKSDEPCRIAHFSRDMNAANPDESRSYEDIDRCDGYGGGADKRVKLGGGAFVTGLRVCLNGGEDRVKGIQLKGRIVNEDGRLSNFNGQPSDSRSNCRDWQNWIECRDGMIAAGYIAYMSTGSNPDSLKGLKLVCRQPVFTAANDEIAFRGKVVVITGGSSGIGLSTAQRVAEALDFHGVGTTRVKVDWIGRADLEGDDDAKLLATLRDDGAPAQLDASPWTMLASATEAPPQTARNDERPDAAELSARIAYENAQASNDPTLAYAAQEKDAPAPPSREQAGIDDDSAASARKVKTVVAPLPPMRPAHFGARQASARDAVRQALISSVRTN